MSRTTSTYLCSELVRVSYQDNFGATHETWGNLEEISSDTATILFDGWARRGSRISLIAQGHPLQGVVQSLTWDAVLGSFAVIRLDESCRWSEERFAPQHMLFVPGPELRARAA